MTSALMASFSGISNGVHASHLENVKNFSTSKAVNFGKHAGNFWMYSYKTFARGAVFFIRTDYLEKHNVGRLHIKLDCCLLLCVGIHLNRQDYSMSSCKLNGNKKWYLFESIKSCSIVSYVLI